MIKIFLTLNKTRLLLKSNDKLFLSENIIRKISVLFNFQTIKSANLSGKKIKDKRYVFLNKEFSKNNLKTSFYSVFRYDLG